MTITSDRRSTTNANDRGNSRDRARRRAWLITTCRADVDVHPSHAGAGPSEDLQPVPLGQGIPAVRCYRCGRLLIESTLTIDRIDLGKDGGRYTRDNIRPACGPCNFGSTRKVGPWRDEQEPGEPDDEPWVSPVEKAWGLS